MRLIVFKLTVLLVLLFIAPNAFASIGELFELYRKRDFISIEYHLNEKQLSGPAKKHAYAVFNATLLNAYGRNSEAVGILQKISASLQNDTLSFLSLKTLNAIAFHDFNYAEAFKIGNILLEKYSNMYDSQEYEELYQNVKIAGILQAVPAQQVAKSDATTVDLHKDAAGLLNIPLTIENTSLSFVFDSGAGMSVIAESTARHLNLMNIGDSTVQIPGSSGKHTEAKLTVAKSIQIGNITVSNAVFLVFPDSALSFAQGKYKMDGIIGFPIIKEFGSLTFINQRQLLVPQKISKRNAKPNMMFDELQPVLILTYSSNNVEERLPFTFDTGANKTTISENFYQRFPYDVNKNGKENKRTFEGVGGKKEFEGVDVANINFKTGKQSVVFKNVFVFKEPFLANGDGYYGNIGQDVIQQFKNVTINFKHSFIEFSN